MCRSQRADALCNCRCPQNRVPFDLSCGLSPVARPLWPIPCGLSSVACPLWLVPCGLSSGGVRHGLMWFDSVWCDRVVETAMKSFDRLTIFDSREKGNNGKRNQLADARIVSRVTATVHQIQVYPCFFPNWEEGKMCNWGGAISTH